ncbi:MAG: DUF4349 domain-containing protein [Chitinispirillaceae bacterium]
MKHSIPVLILIALVLFSGCKKQAVRISSHNPTALSERIEYLQKNKKMLESISYEMEMGNAQYDQPVNDGGPSEPDRPKPERIAFHDAEITARTTDPENLVAHAVNIVQVHGGYLESRNSDRIVLRVPVKQFKQVFDTLLNSFEVIDYSQSSSDITDAFFDTEARIRILRATIKRLREILGETQSEETQIELLAQIKSLSEELEEKLTEQKVLKSKAQYSRIAVDMSLHSPDQHDVASSPVPSGFRWIRELDPFSIERRHSARKFEISVPDGMVKVDRYGLWNAESAGGTRIWTGKLRNRPEGTTDFWVQAVRHWCAKSYLSDTVRTCGDFKIVEFRPYPGQHFVYAVALRVHKKHTYVAEIYYPTSQQYGRLAETVFAALEKVEL